MVTLETLKEHGFEFSAHVDEKFGWVEIDREKLETTLSDEGKAKMKSHSDIPAIRANGKNSASVEITDNGKRYKFILDFFGDGEIQLSRILEGHVCKVEAYRKGNTVLWAIVDEGKLVYLRLPKGFMFHRHLDPKDDWEAIVKDFHRQAIAYDKKMSEQYLKRVEKLKQRYKTREKILNDAYEDLTQGMEEKK